MIILEQQADTTDLDAYTDLHDYLEEFLERKVILEWVNATSEETVWAL
jgi:hypothetical protein